MADFRAIAAVSEAVIHLLRSQMRPVDFGEFLDPQLQLDFRVFTSRDYANSPISNGVSLFLYRIVPNGVRRTPPGRIGPDGRRQQSQLPVELQFLLTVWAGEASLQHALAGWMMRVMEDAALLSSGLLNTVAPGVFRADETVELSLAELSNEDLLRIHEVLAPSVYQLSVPYLARIIHLESVQPVQGEAGGRVQDRVQRAGLFQPPQARS